MQPNIIMKSYILLHGLALISPDSKCTPFLEQLGGILNAFKCGLTIGAMERFNNKIRILKRYSMEYKILNVFVLGYYISPIKQQ